MEDVVLTYRVESGLLVFKLISGDLARANVQLEVLIDDMVFPSYSSTKIKTRTTEFNESEYCCLQQIRLMIC
jgi:Ca2+-dependent lipid-binding protein